MIDAVSSFVESNEDSCLLLADTGSYAFRNLKNKCSERVIDIGIMEDGMVGIAAGMSMAGIIPTIYAITPFIVERSLEQLKLDFIYQRLCGNVITLGASYDFSMLGYSHYCAEDYGVLKNFPGLQIVAPGCGEEMASLYKQCCDNKEFTYYRLTDYPNTNKNDVCFGEAKVIKEGSKLTVIAVANVLDQVLEAVGGEDVTILYYTTLAPFDRKTLAERAHNCKVLVCEPGFEGGLDYEIIKAFDGKPVRISHVGLPHEVFRNYGTKKEKDVYYGLTSDNIYSKYIELLKG